MYTVHIERAGNWKVFQGVFSSLDKAIDRAVEVSRENPMDAVTLYEGKTRLHKFSRGEQIY